MIRFLIVAALLAPVPAQACHRFKYWAYLTPQRCGNEISKIFKPQPKDETWYVEILPDPELTDEQAHALGIEKVKVMIQVPKDQ